MFLDFSRFLLIKKIVSPDQLLRKPCFTAFRRIYVVRLKSAAFRYCDSYVLFVWARMLFTAFSDWCGPRVTSYIPVFLLLVPLIISSPFFWMDIACLSRVKVHLSSHKTSNDINVDVCIFGKMWVCLAILLRPGI